MRWPMPDSNQASHLLATVAREVALWSELNCCPKLLPAQPPTIIWPQKSFIVMKLLQTTKTDFLFCALKSICPNVLCCVFSSADIVLCCVLAGDHFLPNLCAVLLPFNTVLCWWRVECLGAIWNKSIMRCQIQCSHNVTAWCSLHRSINTNTNTNTNTIIRYPIQCSYNVTAQSIAPCSILVHRITLDRITLDKTSLCKVGCLEYRAHCWKSNCSANCCARWARCCVHWA